MNNPNIAENKMPSIDMSNESETKVGSSLAGLIQKDWRLSMFGSSIRLNQVYQNNDDEESSPTYVPTEVAFDVNTYDYIAVFIGANYCPHCREFAPYVVKSARVLEQKKRCKVVFVSGDRDKDNYEASCKKNEGLDAMPFDIEKTKAFRDFFKLTTIPALMILRNRKFENREPEVITNARNLLESDPELDRVQWQEVKGDIHSLQLPLKDMLIISGKYGNWWELGHHINPEHPEKIYMNENAVRIRAGILNTISWFALFNVYQWNDATFVYAIWPVVFLEMLSSMFIGLTPIAPVGTLATIMAYYLAPTPHWKPAEPKRFAWLIGLMLVSMCFIVYMARHEIGSEHARPWLATTIILCNIATWFESSAGFCVGCFIYNNYLTKMFDLEECGECKL